MLLDRLSRWETDFYRFMATNFPELGAEIGREKRMSDELLEQLKTAVEEFKKTATVT